MSKNRMAAKVGVSDGQGGMRELRDLRFEKGRWPHRLDVPSDRADDWTAYLAAEAEHRGWQASALTEHDRQMNSGAIEVVDPKTRGTVELSWSRKKAGPLRVRARPGGAFTAAEVDGLFRVVEAKSNAGALETFHFRQQLEYEGLPWTGEFWLSDRLRLGPASQSYDAALLGPRIIVVDMLVAGIDRMHAGGKAATALRELSAFLSVVKRRAVMVPKIARPCWVYETDEANQIRVSCKWDGYVELAAMNGMPARGEAPAVSLREVKRPDLDEIGAGIRPESREEYLPADVVGLWEAFTGLPSAQREQFLSAASAWQLACSLGYDWATARAALMVVAAEALKPQTPSHRGCNAYDVLETLLGRGPTEFLRQREHHPQKVRNAHLHAAELLGEEFEPHRFWSSYEDPSFRQMTDALWLTVSAALVQWLLQKGQVSIRPRRKLLPWAMLSGAVAAGILAGGVLTYLAMRNR